jgi:hypothetical protein
MTIEEVKQCLENVRRQEQEFMAMAHRASGAIMAYEDVLSRMTVSIKLADEPTEK